MVACWRRDNGRNDWAFGLSEIQYAKNARFHTGIGRSPFKAMFGADPVMGVEGLGIENELFDDINTEEQLEQMFPNEHDEEQLLASDTDTGISFTYLMTSQEKIW